MLDQAGLSAPLPLPSSNPIRLRGKLQLTLGVGTRSGIRTGLIAPWRRLIQALPRLILENGSSSVGMTPPL